MSHKKKCIWSINITNVQPASNQNKSKHREDTIFSYQIDPKKWEIRRILVRVDSLVCGVKHLQNLSAGEFGKKNQKSSKCSYPITPLLGIYTEEIIRVTHKKIVFIYKETH